MIDSETLDVNSFLVGLQINDLDLFDYKSPEIPLFSYGVPGVASLNANLSFGVAATLDAGVTLAMPSGFVQQPGQSLNPLGFAAPTFVGPQLDLSATIAGEIELFGCCGSSKRRSKAGSDGKRTPHKDDL